MITLKKKEELILLYNIPDIISYFLFLLGV